MLKRLFLGFIILLAACATGSAAPPPPAGPTGGALPLIAAGGIGSGADAFERIRAGASLVQLYTFLVYRGPGLAKEIVRELRRLLAREGFQRLTDAIGTEKRGAC